MWARISKNTDLKAIDRLYTEYGFDNFKSLNINDEDIKFKEFIEETISKGPRFNNYSRDELEHFVSKIYELRKNQSNNTSR